MFIIELKLKSLWQLDLARLYEVQIRLNLVLGVYDLVFLISFFHEYSMGWVIDYVSAVVL